MLSKLTLKMKLTVGFGLLLANLVVSGFASYRTILDIQAAAVSQRKWCARGLRSESNLVGSAGPTAQKSPVPSKGSVLGENCLAHESRP